jgi:iron complex outermembrane receptor protein
MVRVPSFSRLTIVVVAAVLALSPFGRGLAFAASPTDEAAISGVVQDPDGRVVVNAAVVARNMATNATAASVTDQSGHFSFQTLPAGRYAVEVTANGFAVNTRFNVEVVAGKTEALTFTLAVGAINEQVDVSVTLPGAARMAPSQGSLEARSAQSAISDQYVRDYTAPVSDFSQVIQMAPGTFNYSANGPGLSDTKTFFRGFQDGFYSMTFDGIPFNDTNDPTHHSQVFFPSQFVGGTVLQRSPGSAASIGPSTFGGSVDLQSRHFDQDMHAGVTLSASSFNTQLYDFQFDSGAVGSSHLLLDVHDMSSDGYQTYNDQHRKGFSAKYLWAISPTTSLTAFTGLIQYNSNTPNQKGATRAQIAQYGDNYLNSGSPTDPNYYGYNLYSIPTNFEYVGYRTDLGHGWVIDDKVYTMYYYNHQQYNSVTTISATSGTDKLNSYRKYGNLLPVTQTSRFGVLRTGLWYEYAKTDRFQTPSSPLTWIDAALPNFHEKFNTTTVQPYAEYSFQITRQLTITPGIKSSRYTQDFTQFADNGKTVGSLNGAPYIQHSATYTAYEPSFDVHYLAQSNWSVYGQYATGNNIPPTSTFDVKNAQVVVTPKPVAAKTWQTGTVYKSHMLTLDFDVFRTTFDNTYTSTTDTSGNVTYFSNGTSTSKGAEAEATASLGAGLFLYGNATKGSSTYDATGLSLQNAPKDTETAGVTYSDENFSIGFFSKRVGQMYNDNGSTHQAITIAPVTISNLFINYTLRGKSILGRSKIKVGINNLSNTHAITGVTPASAATSVPAPGDVLTLMSGRSVSLALTVDFSKK